MIARYKRNSLLNSLLKCFQFDVIKSEKNCITKVKVKTERALPLLGETFLYISTGIIINGEVLTKFIIIFSSFILYQQTASSHPSIP